MNLKPLGAAAGMIAAAAITLAAPAACATGRLLDVQVFDRSLNRELPVYRHNGQLYVVGTPGNEYSVVMRNRTGGDIMTVLSVDGVNAVSGETAAPEQTGYVFSPQQSSEIRGWRTSMERTAAFYFTSLADAYAARTGRPSNVGVIGVAVFRRKVEVPPVTIAPRPLPPFAQNESAARADAARAQALASGRASAVAEAAAAAESGGPPAIRDRAETQDRSAKVERRSPGGPLGTGYGRSELSPTRYTAFERASSTPDETITLFYDSRANLLARGIIPAPVVAHAPQAFPGFVAEPPPR
jgi:hypothetical protein